MGQENANDQTPPPPPPTVWQVLGERIRNAPGSGLAFAVIPLLILGYFGWYYYGADQLDQTLYSLKIENVELSSKPAWIRSDVKEEVFTENSLGKISLLEPEATATIAHAFDAHPWIKTTNQVRKMSDAKVEVDVTYRRPIAMIFFEKQSAVPNARQDRGLLPVDEDGVILPSKEFSQQQVYEYFTVFAPNAQPDKQKTLSFTDPRIADALALCKLLERFRKPLNLTVIDVVPDALDLNLNGFSSWALQIRTEDGRTIVWGHAPGKEGKEEIPAEEKLANLQAWLQTPTTASSGTVIDLRQRRGLKQRYTSTP